LVGPGTQLVPGLPRSMASAVAASPCCEKQAPRQTRRPQGFAIRTKPALAPALLCLAILGGVFCLFGLDGFGYILLLLRGAKLRTKIVGSIIGSNHVVLHDAASILGVAAAEQEAFTAEQQTLGFFNQTNSIREKDGFIHDHLTESRRELVHEILGVLKRPGDSEVQQAVEFLVAFMPESDLLILNATYLAENVRLAMRARKMYADRWGGKISWTTFLNDVLPYASLAEPRDSWRNVFFKYMSRVVDHCDTATCAALALNQKGWSIVNPAIVFQAAKPNELNSYSPFQTMRRHNSSCTGLSIFLVDALRSVGIPARVAGVPHWNKGSGICPSGDADAQCGNHNWVEVFADGAWHFIDQRGGSHSLDRGWFFPGDTNLQTPSVQALNHSIYSTSWAPTSHVQNLDTEGVYKAFQAALYFPMVWDWDNKHIPAWESVMFYRSIPHDS